MCRKATVSRAGIAVLTVLASAAYLPTPAWGQFRDWRRIGNSLVETGLAGLASGPVERVWYSPDGTKLFLRTATGKTFETTDFDRWTPSADVPAPALVGPQRNVRTLPETGAISRTPAGQTPRAYALGSFVYRSDDSGAHWDNLTGMRTHSIVGNGLRDLAVNPSNEDDAVVATGSGVFRTLDGGKSWVGLNQGLPNLPGGRIRNVPSGDRGVQLEFADTSLVEWEPGERTAWRLADNAPSIADASLRGVLGAQRGLRITASAVAGDFVYTGTADGIVDASPDRARSLWQRFVVRDAGAVTGFWVDPKDPRIALAVLDMRPSSNLSATHVIRTVNGGAFWDDLTSDLPDTGVYGVAADRDSGAIYVATARGVFYTRTNLTALGTATPWVKLAGLPDARVSDVHLDEGANQLWAALEGYGVYVNLAPHRLMEPRLVSAADLVSRPAAPGSLLSVLGAKVESARAGDLNVPVLAAGDTESQIQIPFNARGSSLAISVEGAGGRRQLGSVALGSTAPGILVDRDGAPQLVDGDSGVLLDAMHPAHSRTRIQIFATGLGSVTPDWPAGMPAPLENPPQVVAGVRAYLDRTPVEVVGASLAPGYTGFYLVEIEVPKIVNYGPAELYVEAAGQASNRVRVYIEP